MAPVHATTDLQPLIDRQALLIEMLRARIAGFEALTAIIEAQEPPITLPEAHEAILAHALAGAA
jgi:hypothetical protein